MNVEFRLIDNDELFQQIEQEWTALERSVKNEYLNVSYIWLNLWWKCFKDYENNQFGFNKRLKIILVYQEAKLIAIYPFVHLTRKIYGFKITFLEFLSQQWSGIYYAPIGENISPSLTEQVLYWVSKQVKYDVLHLNHIPEEIHFIKAEKYVHGICPYIDMQDANYDSYQLKQYSKNLKTNIKKGYNRAQKDGIRIEHDTKNIDDRLMQDIRNVSKSKELSQKHTIYAEEKKFEFYKRIHQAMQATAITTAWQGSIYAYRTCIRYAGRGYELDTSFDRTHYRYNIGLLTLAESIRNSFANEDLYHEMGPGYDAYKLKFTKEYRKLFAVSKPGNTFLGKLVSPFLSRRNRLREKKIILALESTLQNH